MTGNDWHIFMTFTFFIMLVFISGLYCILVSRNLIRAIIGIELLAKAVTLLFIVVGHINNNMAMAQVFVITIIVIEVVLAAIAGGIALRVFRHNNNLDATQLNKLKG